MFYRKSPFTLPFLEGAPAFSTLTSSARALLAVARILSCPSHSPQALSSVAETDSLGLQGL